MLQTPGNGSIQFNKSHPLAPDFWMLIDEDNFGAKRWLDVTGQYSIMWKQATTPTGPGNTGPGMDMRSHPGGAASMRYDGTANSNTVANTIGSQGVTGFYNPLAILSTTPFSGCAWINPTVGNAGDIISNWTAGTNPGWEFSVTAAGNVNLRLMNAGATAGRSVSGGTTLTAKWYHVAFTYDGSNTAGGITVYVNGVKESLTTVLNTDPGTLVNNNIRMAGTSGGSPSDPYVGLANDIRLYGGRCLNAMAIQSIYQDSKMGSPELFTRRPRWQTKVASVFTQNCSYDGTGTYTISNKAISILHAYGTIATETVQRAIAFLRSYGAIGTPSALKNTSTSKSYGATGTYTFTDTINYVRSLAYGAIGTLSRKVNVGFNRGYASTGTYTRGSNSIGKSVGYGAIGSHSATKGAATSRSYGAIGTPSALKSVAKILSYGITATETALAGIAHFLTIAYGAVGTFAITKSVGSTRRYGATGTYTRGSNAIGFSRNYGAIGGLSGTKAITASKSYGATGTPSATKNTATSIGYGAISIASVLKSAGKHIQYSIVGLLTAQAEKNLREYIYGLFGTIFSGVIKRTEVQAHIRQTQVASSLTRTDVKGHAR